MENEKISMEIEIALILFIFANEIDFSHMTIGHY